MEAVILTIEVAQRCDREGWHWDVILSKAASAGTFIKTWDNAKGQLSEPQSRDLTAFAMQALTEALLAWGGVQGVLEP